MVPRVSYPPAKTTLKPTTLAPTEAQALLSTFLAKTASKPYLHPDAQLSTVGITYAAASGPTGGLAIHHLKRIEAGLRGEHLVAETEEELKTLFAEAAGDDSRVDGVIAGKKRKRTAEQVAQWAEDASAGAEQGDAAAGEWQDADEYALGQEDVTGEVGARGTEHVRQDRSGPPEIQDGGKVDKEARKAAKKAKKAAEKKERLEKKS